MILKEPRMRLAALAFCTVMLSALHGSAQTVKDVNVLNFPEEQAVFGDVIVTNDATDPVPVVGAVEVTNHPAAPSTPDPYQLVGFSTTERQGNGGVLTFTLDCQADFGPAAHMCTTSEIMETAGERGGRLNACGLKNPRTGRAWTYQAVERVLETADRHRDLAA
jgi:hypothetical protein